MNIALIRLDYYNNLCYAKISNFKLNNDDKVIVSIDHVLYSGTIVKIIVKCDKKIDIDANIVRVLINDDIKKIESNENDSKTAIKFASKAARELGLEMNFVECFYSFDRNQLVFDFLSDSRVDFRELAKKLAGKYKTRIEFCQIGVRDKAKKVGGLGPCGMFLCCNSFLNEFNSVSINMGKNQFLALNPTKINGICGRLLCCLGYEDETYSKIKKELPKIGSYIDTPGGNGKVIDINIFNKTYKVDLGDKGIIEYKKDDYEKTE